MAIVPLQNSFLNETVRPIIGSYANTMEPNCLKQAKLSSDDTILPGQPIVVLVATPTPVTNGARGFNPNSQVITKVATTTNTGANDTAVCGFMGINSTDAVIGSGVGVAQIGDIVNYAPLGQGALIWLEVASQNESAFKANLDANVALTIDATNGGVKVGSGGDVLVGAKLIQGLTNCQKIVKSGSDYVLQNCYGVLVQLD